LARLARVVAVGVLHHVTQRGNARRFILDCDADRVVYMNLLRENIVLYKVSERHACGQMEILRALVRYQARGRRQGKANERLRVRLRELAEERRRWGAIGGCTFCSSGKDGR
jgi:hypothetical protein